jgi:hypothetical protein
VEHQPRTGLAAARKAYSFCPYHFVKTPNTATSLPTCSVNGLADVEPLSPV